MARALVFANGKFAVTLDRFGFVRDVYYHYVGLENHVMGQAHRIGIMVNQQFSWLDDGSWQISPSYKTQTMVGYLLCKNEKLGVSLNMEDCVYNETEVFLRKIDIYNHSTQTIQVKVFFHQVFAISESRKRNTAFYDPTHNALVHYKGRRVFVINGRSQGHGMSDYAVGEYETAGKAGTYKDAEDGVLSKNAVEHGNVDSVMCLSVEVDKQSKNTVYYWFAAGKTLEEAYAINTMVLEKTPEGMLKSTEEFWRAWLTEKNFQLADLDEKIQKQFEISLLILRAHTDNRGAIIASSDSSMIEFGKDDYAYVWPRDAAFVSMTLDQAGYHDTTKVFFQFCQNVLHPDGYLHHRYRSDQSLGSTWHSTTTQQEWLAEKKLQLPIQEDETASVLVALWHHYQYSKDIEFIENLYKPMIEKMANFLMSFRHAQTGLPLPSFDLWEEKIGVSTYTCAAVYGGLMAAARFSELLGKRNHMRAYRQAAKEIKAAACQYLYNHDLGTFIRLGYWQDGRFEQEKIIDSSVLFGLWFFNLIDKDDPMYKSTKAQVLTRLANPTPIGGFCRYEGDVYFKSGRFTNPWLITTLWLAQEKLADAFPTEADLAEVKKTLSWAADHAYISGVLPEQLDPNTGESLSATPLVWSHSVFAQTVMQYISAKNNIESTIKPPLPKIYEL